MAERNFEQWLAELNRISVEKYCHENPYVDDTGPEYWLSFFEDGLTPEQALLEDYSYA